MSLKFEYNNNTYIFIQNIGPADAAIANKISNKIITSPSAYSEHPYFFESILKRKDLYPNTWIHLSYDEIRQLGSYQTTDKTFAVVKHPLEKCKSLYNYLKVRKGWLQDYNFFTYWSYVIEKKDHDVIANVAPSARAHTLQSNIVGSDTLIYKFEDDLVTKLNNEFLLDLTEDQVEDVVENIITDEELEQAIPFIEKHFEEDYERFGYSKSL